MRRALAMMAAAAAFAAFGSGSAFAATIEVDNNNVECPNAVHHTIQDGVDAAGPNDRVVVCNGRYQEQVVISGPSKNGVQVLAKVVHGATIQPPQDFFATDTFDGALVLVDGAQNVQVRRFNISGPFLPEDCGQLMVGVAVVGGGKATIRDNVINDIRPAFNSPIFTLDPFPCDFPLQGIAVAVGDVEDGGGDSEANTAYVIKNKVLEYGTIGIGFGPGTTGQAHDNTVDGLASAAIGLFTFQVGIAVFDAKPEITANKVTRAGGFPFFPGAPGGITLIDARPQTKVKGNQVWNNFGTGIALVDSDSTLIDRNRVHDNSFGGIFADGGSEANTFNRNDARTNENEAGSDCNDGSLGTGTAGTANTWTFNKGLSETPLGICLP